MNLAVCILHYGDPELTAKLYAQFAGSGVGPDGPSGGAGHIHVLDNASPKPYPDAWTRLPENLFWGGAFDWAISAFREKGYTHLWFCNNDMTFVSDPPYYGHAVSRIRALEKRGGVGLYSPAATSNPYHAQMVAQTKGQCRRVEYIDGIAPVLCLDCAMDIGGLDLGQNPYGYGADVWLSLRAARQGWGVWVDDSLVLRHKYHVAARDVSGFLDRAAAAEDLYLTERIGPGWRETLKGLQ